VDTPVFISANLAMIRGASILLVEDNELNQEVATELLTEAGFKVDLAVDGAVALQKIGAVHYDLVLMDANMPVVDGYRACAEIRRSVQGGDVGIIMITALDDDESVERAFAAGAEEYINKPIRWVVLQKRIRLSLEKRFANEQITEARARMEAIVNTAADAIVVINEQGVMESVNRAASRLFNYPMPEMVGKNVSMLMPAPHRERHDGYLVSYLATRGGSKVIGVTREMVALRNGGALVPIELTISEVRLKDRLLFTGILRDITERKEAEEKIFHQAHYDALTGLANRSLFMSTLEDAIQRAKTTGRELALLFVDLDRFKWVNDNLGHAAGDALLKAASGRIREPVLDGDTVARLGGDEFTAVLVDCTPERAVESARRILHRLNEPFELEGKKTFISGSLGVAFFPNDSQNQHDLLKCADEAMYRSKRAGRNACHFYAGESFSLPRNY
ncbi:MAG: diguanylate cyclase, partial [Magnetococcales bacterium]|nr:diguanylate cyclase [Magnetococcales bacterium]